MQNVKDDVGAKVYLQHFISMIEKQKELIVALYEFYKY